MNRGEWAVTVLGLLGTFLLPWPGERASLQASAVEPAPRVQAAACQSVRPFSADRRRQAGEMRAVAPAVGRS